MEPSRARSARLRALLKRGTLVATAHWPLVLAQFAADALFKVLIAIAVFGGVLLVALTLGRDISDLIDDDVRRVATTVGETLVDQPFAFAAFLLSLSAALVTGGVIALLVKAGTMAILVRGEAALGDEAEDEHVGLGDVLGTSQASLSVFQDGARRFIHRFLVLAAWLMAIYALTAAVYLGIAFGIYRTGTLHEALLAGGLAASGTVVLLGWITLVNWLYLLVQMVIVRDDTTVRAAVARVRGFLWSRDHDLLWLFAVVFALVVVATLASLVATAVLGAASFVPVIGLAVMPLQAVAWLVRGIIFQFIALAALCAYLAVYRRWAASAPASAVSEGSS